MAAAAKRVGTGPMAAVAGTMAQLAVEAAAGADAAGGKSVVFNTITVSDGISMGTPGMRYSLVSREVIADSIEAVAGAEGFDGLVTIGGEQPLVRHERGFDLGVARQDGGIGHAESIGRLALGEQVVIYPLLAHDPGRFVGHGLAHQVGSRVGSSAHRSRTQNSVSSAVAGSTLSASTSSAIGSASACGT